MTPTWSENWENGWEIRCLYLVQLVSLIGAFYCLAPMRVVHFKLMVQMAGNILRVRFEELEENYAWKICLAPFFETQWELYAAPCTCVMLCEANSYCVMLCEANSYCVMLCEAHSYCVMLCEAHSYCVMLCEADRYCVMLCEADRYKKGGQYHLWMDRSIHMSEQRERMCVCVCACMFVCVCVCVHVFLCV